MSEPNNGYKTETEFADLRASFLSREVDISLPRQVARQFFLRIRSAEVKRTTGKSIALKKAAIWLMNVGSPITFVLSLTLIILQYGPWEASLIVPIAGICWTIIYGLTSDQGGWLIGTIPLLLSGIEVVDSGQLGNPLFLFVLSIWLQRTSYLLATYWLLDIVMSSFDAFEMMEEHISIEPS